MAVKSNIKNPVPAHNLRHNGDQLASSFPPMLIAAERIASAMIQGMHGRRRAGPGEDFWQFRPYVAGDSLNRIDWRKSGRHDRVFVRENEWAASNTLYIWTSNTTAMNYRSQHATASKGERANIIALALAIMAAKAGERVAAIGAPFTPGHTMATLNQLANWLAHQTQSDDAGLPPQTPLPKYASCLLISDFFNPIDEVEAALRAIAARGVRGHMVQILDPAEKSFPFSGPTEFVPFAGEAKITFGRAENLKATYREKFTAHQSTLRDLTRRLGWSFTTHHTAKPAAQAVLALYHRMAHDLPSHQRAAKGS